MIITANNRDGEIDGKSGECESSNLTIGFGAAALLAVERPTQVLLTSLASLGSMDRHGQAWQHGSMGGAMGWMRCGACVHRKQVR